jgi:hypothetical protein
MQPFHYLGLILGIFMCNASIMDRQYVSLKGGEKDARPENAKWFELS